MGGRDGERERETISWGPNLRRMKVGHGQEDSSQCSKGWVVYSNGSWSTLGRGEDGSGELRG